MLHKLKAFNTKNNFINLLFATIPLSFIAGNLVLNLNILLFILTAIIFFKGEIFRFKYDLLDKLIVIFFFLYSFNSFFELFLKLQEC